MQTYSERGNVLVWNLLGYNTLSICSIKKKTKYICSLLNIFKVLSKNIQIDYVLNVLGEFLIKSNLRVNF